MIDILCIVVFLLALLKQTGGYRIYDTTTNAPNGSYFKPYDRGFVGTYGLASNLGRERINEGLTSMIIIFITTNPPTHSISIY